MYQSLIVPVYIYITLLQKLSGIHEPFNQSFAILVVFLLAGRCIQIINQVLQAVSVCKVSDSSGESDVSIYPLDC